MQARSPKQFKLAEIAEMAECLRRGVGRPLNREELEFFKSVEEAIEAEETLSKAASKAA
jgi:hypothetical protein